MKRPLPEFFKRCSLTLTAFALFPLLAAAQTSAIDIQGFEYLLQTIDTLPPVLDDMVIATELSPDSIGETGLRDTLSIVAVGDMMLGTIYPAGKLPANNNCAHQLSLVAPILKRGDVTFANLEGALVDSLTGMKMCSNPAICYVFGMPTSYARCIEEAGINLLSLANNHAGDFGETGRKQTLATLEKTSIAFAGLANYCPSTVFEKEGVRYGFCAFAPNVGTVDVRKLEAAEAMVRALDSVCDVVIVSFHAGAEGRQYQNVTRATEMYLGENRGNVYEFAHRMIDAGADVLLGHGPHVTRAIEVYRERFIAYSMGNFCTFANINIAGVNGVAPIFDIRTDREGRFLEGQLISTYQEKFKPVRVDTTQRVLKIVQSLTETDFPEMKSVISIDEKGFIRYLRPTTPSDEAQPQQPDRLD